MSGKELLKQLPKINTKLESLKQIWGKGSARYRTPICGTPLLQKSEIDEWVRQRSVQLRVIKKLALTPAYYKGQLDLLKELSENLKQLLEA